MRIIIEGADGTGKTTLAKKLANEYGLGFMHLTNLDPRDMDFYYQLLRKDNMVYDRNFLAEMIYPKVFNRPSKLKQYEFEYLMAKAGELEVKFIILTAEIDILRKRLAKKQEYKCVKRNISYINEDFLKYAGKYNLPVIDTGKNEERLTYMEAKKCTKLM